MRDRVRSAFVCAVSSAIAAALLQVVIASTRRFALQEFIWVSRDFVWMVPVGYLTVFVGLALPLILITLVLPNQIADRTPVFCFGTLATLGVVLMFPGVHPLASLIISVGAGVRLAMSASPAAIGRRWRWWTGAAASLALVAGWREMTYRRTEARATSSLAAAPQHSPNVLLIILDTVRAASMSFMGYGRPTTPELAKLAAGGTVFDEAYSVAPWTLPSHAGIFTARYPSSLSVDWRVPLDARPATMAEAFNQRGFATAGFAANHFYTSWESGLTRGFAHYEDYRRTWKQALLSISLLQTNLFWTVVHDLRPGNLVRQLLRMDLRTQLMWTSDRKLAGEATAEFLAWERTRGERPFFAFINLYDAHLPYDPPAPWGRAFAQSPEPLDRYDGSIAYMDHELGRMFDELQRRGVLDQTIVVVTSDHGEGFGEHGLHGHGNSLYRPELHVPLILRYPGRVPAGQRVQAAVSLRDLGATMFDLAGLPPWSGGGSLATTWAAADSSSQRSPVLSEVSVGINTDPSFPVSRGAMRSLIDSTSHYIRNGDGLEELYDYRGDPAENRDLARSDSTRVGALRAASIRAANLTRLR
ncbi:MAG: sulfatase [Gemmatimonadaceae bacterium]